MKKLACVVLSALLLVASISLSACSNSSTEDLEDQISELENLIEDQNKKIEDILAELEKTNKLMDTNYNEIVRLTKDNFDDYISINLYYDNFFYKSDGTINALYCVGNLTTSPKIDCIFSNVSIRYQIEIVGWAVDSSRINIELSYLGDAHTSFVLHQTSSVFLSPDSYTITVKEIYGTALVHKLP